MQSVEPSSTNESPVNLFESRLIRGGTRLVADLTEFFRDYRVEDTTFTIYARGSTRNRGFLLSRFFAWTVLPNYSVSLFCVDEGGALLTTEKVRKNLDTVTRITKDEDLKWAWLVFFSNRDLPPPIVSFIARYDKKELGLAAASTSSGQIVLSNNQVGRSIGRQLKLGKTRGSTRSWKS
jgi:hypothetical protein